MTQAFDRFVAQYESGGRLKWDGYSPDQFEGLTAYERQQVRGMLTQELWYAPDMAIDGLQHLGPDAERATLVAFLQEPGATQVPGVDAVYWALWKLTGDIDYQRRQILAHDQCLPDDRAAFLCRLGETPNTPQALHFYRQRVLDEPDGVTRRLAARAFLVRCGVPFEGPAAQARFAALEDRLTDGPRPQRLAVMAEAQAESRTFRE